jgi:AcrR family transcriptional regulator
MARSAKNYPFKREELLSISENIFLEKGYEQATINDILVASGISKGAFYHYFGSKEEILVASIENIMDKSVAYLQPNIDDEKLGAMDKFIKFMHQKSDFQTQNLEYASLLGKLMHSEIFQQKYVMIASQKIVPLFAKLIQQGIEEGVFSVSYPYETAEILIRTIVSVPISTSYEDYLSSEEHQMRYLLSLKGVIAGTLGIEMNTFSLYYE